MKRSLFIRQAIVIFYGLFLSLGSASILAQEQSVEEEMPTPAPQNLDSASFATAAQLITKKEWGEATIILKRVVEKNPKHFEAVDALAKTLTYLRRREEALALLIRTHSLYPDPKWVERIRVISKIFIKSENFQRYQTAVDFMVATQWTKALDRLKEVHAEEPHNLQILLRLGQCHLKEKQVDIAWEYLETAKKLNPFEPELRLWLGRALALRGSLGQALENIDFAMKGLPQSELAPVWKADILSGMGKTAEAIQLLRKDLERNPIHVLSLLKMSDLQASDEKNKKELLWEARSALQLAVSRMSEYQALSRNRFESELGFHMETPSEIKERIQTQLLALDRRINSRSPEL